MVDCPRQHGVRQVLSCTPASHFALSPTHPELLVPRIPHSLLSSMVSAGMTEEWREAAILAGMATPPILTPVPPIFQLDGLRCVLYGPILVSSQRTVWSWHLYADFIPTQLCRGGAAPSQHTLLYPDGFRRGLTIPVCGQEN